MRYRLRLALKVFNRGERGTVLPLVLIALLLTGLLIPPLMGLIGTSLKAGQMYENNSYELYAADAGVMDAIWFLKTLVNEGEDNIDPEIFDAYITDGKYTDTLTEDINGKSVTYEIVRDGYEYIITSTATDADGSTTTIETRVAFPPPPPPVMMAVGATNGDLDINAVIGSADNKLAIYANGNILMQGSGEIYADAYQTAGYRIIGSGGEYPEVRPPTWKEGDRKITRPMELVEGIIPEQPTITTPRDPNVKVDSNGNVTINGTDGVEKYELGPILIEGDLTITTVNTGDIVQVELKGTVWVTGKIQVNGDAIVYGTYDTGDIPDGSADLYSKYEDGQPYFMVSYYDGKNAISANGNTPDPADVDGIDYKVDAILYAPNGDIFIGGHAKFKGSAVGEKVEITGDSSLDFALPFQPAPPEYPPIEIKYWKIF